jgi:folate-dependent phosphoribosylglycinamide formyltransferase PurN
LSDVIELGWFSTGRGPGSRGLFTFVQERVLRGEIDARIQFVFSNREPGEAEGSDAFFDLVRSHEIPLVTFSSRGFRRSRGGRFADHREEFDKEVMERLSGFEPDLSVLAGYMLYTGAELCARYPMINLHPALPDGPIGTWQEVIWELIETGVGRTGAMVHLATYDWDRGPLISYFSLPIKGGAFAPLWKEIEGKPVDRLKTEYGEELPLFKMIRAEGYRREPYIISETIKAVANGTIRVDGQRVLDAEGDPLRGYDLSRQIEASLSADGV